jgi:acetyl esterase/lipase
MNRCVRSVVVGLVMLWIVDTASAQPTQRGADASQIIRKWIDVPYANASPAQKLDIYLPNDGDGPYPVIVAIHGGGFKFGDKASGEIVPMLAALDRGYAVVSINYRLSGEAKWPAPIQDVKAAIRWIKANSAKYRFEPNRIATWGDSAGGYLSAMAGVSAGIDALEDKQMGSADQTSRVQAAVDWFGPIDFLKMDEQFKTSGIDGMKHSTPDSFESQLLGQPITDAPDVVKAASPETYITGDDPPFFIQHGSADPLIPIQQSEQFAARLKQVLGPEKVVFESLDGAGHGGPQFADPNNVARVLDFLDQHSK